MSHDPRFQTDKEEYDYFFRTKQNAVLTMPKPQPWWTSDAIYFCKSNGGWMKHNLCFGFEECNYTSDSEYIAMLGLGLDWNGQWKKRNESKTVSRKLNKILINENPVDTQKIFNKTEYDLEFQSWLTVMEMYRVKVMIDQSWLTVGQSQSHAWLLVDWCQSWLKSHDFLHFHDWKLLTEIPWKKSLSQTCDLQVWYRLYTWYKYRGVNIEQYVQCLRSGRLHQFIHLKYL